MIMFIAAAVIALLLYRQEIRHRAELTSRNPASIQTPPVPFLEGILSVVVGTTFIAVGVRMLWNMIHGYPAVIAIDNAQSVAVILGTGLIICLLGARALPMFIRNREGQDVDARNGRE